jgi:hypothetical protein
VAQCLCTRDAGRHWRRADRDESMSSPHAEHDRWWVVVFCIPGGVIMDLGSANYIWHVWENWLSSFVQQVSIWSVSCCLHSLWLLQSGCKYMLITSMSSNVTDLSTTVLRGMSFLLMMLGYQLHRLTYSHVCNPYDMSRVYSIPYVCRVLFVMLPSFVCATDHSTSIMSGSSADSSVGPFYVNIMTYWWELKATSTRHMVAGWFMGYSCKARLRYLLERQVQAADGVTLPDNEDQHVRLLLIGTTSFPSGL